MAYVHTQLRLPILAFQTDNGREFDSTALRLLFLAHGVQLGLSCPYMSQQNDKAECILQTLNDYLCTLLIHSAAPLEFWAEALTMATHLINRHPCRATSPAMPFALLFGMAPCYDEIRVFGCRWYPNLTAMTCHKLDARSTTYVFIGYPVDHHGYRYYNITTWRIITSCHIVFDKSLFLF